MWLLSWYLSWSWSVWQRWIGAWAPFIGLIHEEGKTHESPLQHCLHPVLCSSLGSVRPCQRLSRSEAAADHGSACVALSVCRPPPPFPQNSLAVCARMYVLFGCARLVFFCEPAHQSMTCPRVLFEFPTFRVGITFESLIRLSGWNRDCVASLETAHRVYVCAIVAAMASSSSNGMRISLVC